MRDDFQNSIVGKMPGESVGSQQQGIFRLCREVAQIGLHGLLGSERAQDDVLKLGLLGLLGGHQAPANMFHHQRVILRELLDGPLAQQIDAAIADVRDGIHPVLDQERGQGRSHSALLGVLCGGRTNLLVGQLDCIGQEVGASGDALQSRGSGFSLLLTACRQYSSRESTAILLATSPAASPPMPSQTT